MNKHDDRKTIIIETAISLFQNHGVENVTVKDICDEMGVARSSFYYYFKSKEELLDYFFLSTEVEINKYLLPLLESENSYEQFLKIFKIYMNRTVQWGSDIFSHVIKRYVDGKNNLLSPDKIAMKDVYLHLIKQAQVENSINNKEDPQVLLNLIVYIADGLACHWSNSGGNFSYPERMEEMIEKILQPKMLD